ncbi:hypothetical protein GPUN_1908 [Glaciecola punicea ACAM 611]|jgi:hypothetical protein|uniref:Uncharacterized protein n=1 Tax=Glaciecola punicea ACAM 611 TaxID=1121923 RepID=H5TCJ7_9ALTE|nr:hypothetical protein [Glaciecola punicea]GAB56024.1 hypothetical protein GPUN_1908 [Glaciecola punicea ACAM 611]
MEPNYARYTIDELLEAKRSIEKEENPDEYEEIVREISIRQQTEPSGHGSPQIDSGKTSPLRKKLSFAVARLSLFPLVMVKIIAGTLCVYYGLELFDGYVLQEVVRRDQLLTLAQEPTSYYIRMLTYFVISLAGLWVLTFGTKLRKSS